MITDLLYSGVSAQVRKAFPNAKISDASDMVHEERIEVEVEATQEEWWRFLLQERLGGISLNFRLTLEAGSKENRDKLIALAKELKLIP